MKTFTLLLTAFLFTSATWASPTETSYTFKGIKIVVTTDPDAIAPNSAPPLKIPSWSLATFKGPKKLDSVTFKNIEAVGGLAGIFPYESQPFEDFYSFNKEGDYDSRCLLVSKNGKILNIPCTELFKDQKKYYLIRNDDAEDRGGGAIVRATGKLETFMGAYPPESKSLQKWDFSLKKWVKAKPTEE